MIEKRYFLRPENRGWFSDWTKFCFPLRQNGTRENEENKIVFFFYIYEAPRTSEIISFTRWKILCVKDHFDKSIPVFRFATSFAPLGTVFSRGYFAYIDRTSFAFSFSFSFCKTLRASSAELLLPPSKQCSRLYSRQLVLIYVHRSDVHFCQFPQCAPLSHEPDFLLQLQKLVLIKKKKKTRGTFTRNGRWNQHQEINDANPVLNNLEFI